MSIRRSLKGLLERIFVFASKMGVIIMPKHYYVPISDPNFLDKNRYWNKPSEMVGIDADPDDQMKALRSTVYLYKDEYADWDYTKDISVNAGPGFGYIEAQALHGYMRHLRPQKIIEVGSGVSTQCMLRALDLCRQEDPDYQFNITCVEPYPSEILKHDTRLNLVERRVEDVDLVLFESLAEGDFLFIDSSHAIRTGSDVITIYNEILPRLKPGVFIHIHDIYFPYLFQRNPFSFMQWHETSLLQAFLSFNESFSIQFSLSMLHYAKTDELNEVFPQYKPESNDGGISVGDTKGKHFPASTFIVRNK